MPLPRYADQRASRAHRMAAKTERYRFVPWEIEDVNGIPRRLPGGYADVTRGGGMKYDQVVFRGPDNTGLSQSFGVYGSLSMRAGCAPPNPRGPMILSAIAEKLKRRAQDDFKGRHFEAALILQAVSWYLRYPLSYRDIEELFLERGLEVDHSTLNRWVLAYAPLIEKRLRAFRKPPCGSIRVDEIYIKIRGQWRYLYRAIDKHGTPVDFLLTAKRDLEAAKRFFRKALNDQPLFSPDRIGTDGAGAYPPAIAAARKAGLLARTPVHYVTKHLQQGIESDHFRVKRPMPRVGCFQAFHTRGVRSRASKPCCGCARASALPAAGRCASRTGCSQSVSVSQRLTKCETGVGPAHPAAYVRLCDMADLFHSPHGGKGEMVEIMA